MQLLITTKINKFRVWALTVVIHNCYDELNKSRYRMNTVLSLQ